jgi:O-acetyl-ADP-ribose deacetylase
MLQTSIGTTTLTLLQGDITTENTDAIVNAANSALLGGGGVDGAIHRAAGPELLEACRALGGCPTGDARITRGYNLNTRYVIHAVGPIWKGGHHDEDAQLAGAYRTSLQRALENGLRSIAFPSISTGAYRFPPDRASRLAFSTVTAFLKDHPSIAEVRFVVFSQHDYDTYAPLFTQSE